MQLEELLDKLKEEKNKQKKHDIAIKHKTCNVRELKLSIMFNNNSNY